MTRDSYGMEPLFCNGDLREWLENARALALAEIDRIDAGPLMNTAFEALVDSVLERHSVDPIVLNEPTIETVATKLDARYLPNRVVFDESRPVWVDGSLVRLRLTFSGDAALFGLKPMTFDFNPPRGRLENEILIVDSGWPEVPSPEEVERWVRETISRIEQSLNWQRPTVADFNRTLRDNVSARIGKKRQSELARRNLQKALPFKLHQRADAPLSLAVDGLKRKRVVPFTPVTSQQRAPFTPEPELSDQQFGEILAIIRAIGQTMERMPEAFAELGEESLRAIFLAALNAQFEGSATGETFNYGGKTDILVREGIRNLLIGECKIWQGARAFTGDAHTRGVIDQVLDYVAWRDASAVILLFVRTKQVTQVAQQIPELVRQHPNVRGDVRQVGASEWHCRIAQRDDPDRELTLALTAFHFPL